MHPQKEKHKNKTWLKKISTFFGHAFIIAVLGGILLGLFQANQAAKQERLTRQEQLQDRQYALLASFSDQFDQYIVLLYNLRMMQIDFTEWKANTNHVDFIGRSKAEVLPVYQELSKEILQHPRGEAVLVSIRALFQSKAVNDDLDGLDEMVLRMQHGGPDDGNLSPKEIMGMDRDVEKKVRQLAVDMRQELAGKRHGRFYFCHDCGRD